ncbi:MAG: SIS domain-containing protein, partial [Gemmatimonadetes bacterium]|nr:SIS domain-containing protein [Gemmatimonadota bacterium]
MNRTVTDYLARLSALLLSTEVTDGAGRPVGLDDGTAAAVRLVLEVRGAGGKVLLVGNGGSAAIASHMQNDLCKMAGIRALVFTEAPLLTALT